MGTGTLCREAVHKGPVIVCANGILRHEIETYLS